MLTIIISQFQISLSKIHSRNYFGLLSKTCQGNKEGQIPCFHPKGFSFFLLSCLICSQIWLNYLLDDHTNLTTSQILNRNPNSDAENHLEQQQNQDHHKLERVHKIAKIQGKLKTRSLKITPRNKTAQNPRKTRD